MEAGMCSCDYDPVKCFTRLEPTARKEHKCIECKEVIKPGEKYYRLKYLFDDEWWNEAVCTPCEHIRRDYCAPFGMLREVLRDALSFDYVTGRYYGVEK